MPNTFDAIFFTSEFCCALLSIVTYTNVPTISALSNQSRAILFAQLFRCEKKLKAIAYLCACNPAMRGGVRNLDAYVQASDALTATSRLHS